MLHPLPALLLALAAAPARVRAAFGFSTSSATSCGDFTVTWSGGSGPFQLSLFPAFAASVAIPIPADAQGTFTTQLPLNSSARFVAVMSDSTGFAAGGISPVIDVDAAKGGASCNTQLAPAWTWNSNSAVQQCNPYIINMIDPNTVSYPLTITTLVPGGTSKNYSVASGTGFTINAINVAAGSQLLVSLSDAAGRTGGDSDLYTVLQTSETSCLSSALTSTAVPQSSSTAASSASGSASATSTGAPSDAATISGGTIGAIAAAGVVGIGAIAALGFFCWRRNGGANRRARRRMDMGADYDSPTLLAATQHRYEPEPFTLGAGGGEHGGWANGSPNSSSDMMPGAAGATVGSSRYTDTPTASQSGRSGYGGGPGSVANTSRSGKSNRTNSMTQPRFIVHTDAADEIPEAPEEEVIELPPQYNEARRPTPAYPADGAAGSSSSIPLGDVKRR